MKRKEIVLAIGIFAALAAILALVYIGTTSVADGDAGTRAEEDNSYMDTATYIGSDACATCHNNAAWGNKNDNWANTLHSKMLQDPSPATVIGDFLGPNPVFNDTGAGIPDVTIELWYNSTSGNYTVAMGTNNYTVWKTLGSAWKQRYLAQIGNSRYILPIQWNTATSEWVPYHLSDWYDTSGNPKPIAKDASWDRKCAGCHSTGVNITYNTTTQEWTASWSELNVGCEACHGPGSDHNGDATKIWKSADSQVCGQCHIRGSAKDDLGVAGKAPGYPWNNGRFKPGDSIDDYYNHNPSVWGDGNTSKSHHQQFNDWNQSLHKDSLVNLVSKPYAQDDCLHCMSTDYRLAPEGSKPNLTTAKWGIECVACHDTHEDPNEHQLRLPTDQLCIDCHTMEGAGPGDTPDHSQKEMLLGDVNLTEVPGSPWMSGAVSCVDCHTPKVAKSALSYDISSHTFRAITPAHGIQYNMPNSCTVACHTDTTPGTTYTDQEADEIVTNWTADFEELVPYPESALTSAEQALADATDLGFTDAQVSAAQAKYDKALFAFELTDADGSGGVHNHDLQTDLLDYSNTTALQVVDDLTPGSMSGVIKDKDGEPLENAEIRDSDGTVWATTNANGEFTFDHAPGTLTFDVFYENGDVGDVSGTIQKDQTTDVGDIEVDVGGEAPPLDMMWIYIAIAVIIIIVIIIAAVVAARRGGAPPEEPLEEEEPPTTE
ncbi:MAG: ammonia-forming cytochrome c nitrite reductase subunit c552 [Thermoplasmata archaeon]